MSEKIEKFVASLKESGVDIQIENINEELFDELSMKCGDSCNSSDCGCSGGCQSQGGSSLLEDSEK